MTDRKAQLQKAIITNDMELVRDFFQFVFGETAPKTLYAAEKGSSADLIAYKNKMEKIREIISEGNETEEVYSFTEAIEEKDLSVNKSAAGMQFISSGDYELPEDSMKNYKETLKKVSARKKTRRDTYKPKMVNCDSCGVSFDFNKEYPVGQLESGANAKKRCNSCRSK